MTATIPAGEGWIAHTPGPMPECVAAHPEKYETLGENGSIEHGFAGSGWWEHAADRPELYIIAYRLACPVARERIAELEASLRLLTFNQGDYGHLTDAELFMEQSKFPGSRIDAEIAARELLKDATR